MSRDIQNFYREFSKYTYPGKYLEELAINLPDDIRMLGVLVRKQLIHRATLKHGNTGTNFDLRYGDMTKVPWYRQPEDDIFPTASSIITELYRRDPKGVHLERAAENKLVLTCRFTSVLVASLLKIKGIPARVRSGFAPYFEVAGLDSSKSNDHWVNQYWDSKENRWVTIDVDGSLEDYLKFDPYDVPSGKFDFSADAWLKTRDGTVDENYFWNAGGTGGLIAISWELFYDFHCLMNDEVIYMHTPEFTFFKNFPNISDEKLSEIDELAELMLNPDKNFDALTHLWETNKSFRLLKGGLL